MTTRQFRYCSLPDSLYKEILFDIANYSVGFFRIPNASNGTEFSLLGSGTLVTLQGDNKKPIYAVLTAQHVIEVLPTSGKMGWCIGTGSTSHAEYPVDGYPMTGSRFLKIARGNSGSDYEGPDLGAILR